MTTYDAFGRPSAPDFAMPQRTAAQALKDLDSACKKGDGTKALEALIVYATAENLITQDNFAEGLRLVQATEGRFAADPATQAMCKTLEATLLWKYYNNNQYVYNQRTYVQDEPYPEDIAQWSGRQFTDSITAAFDAALAHKEALAATPLRKYRGAIEGNNQTWIYYPTAYDFVVLRAIDFFDSKDKERVQPLYQQLLDLHSDSPAPYINYLVESRNYDDIESAFEDDDDADDNNPAQYQAFDGLMKIYDRFSAESEYAADALLVAGDVVKNLDDWQSRRVELFDAVNKTLAQYPNYWRKNDLVNLKNRLKVVDVQAQYPRVVITGHPFDITVVNRNAQRYCVKIYQLPKNFGTSGTYRYQGGKLPQCVFEREVTHPANDRPFVTADTITANIEDNGMYFVVINQNGQPQKDEHYSVFQSASIYGYSGCVDGNNFALALEPWSGQPISDVNVWLEHITRGSKMDTIKFGTTDAHGMAYAPKATSWESGTMYYQSRDGRRFVDSRYLYSAKNETVETVYEAIGYTSLALYRPGDEVEWAFVVAQHTGDQRSLSAGRKIKVALRDANHTVVEQGEFVTDEYGRIAGKWRLPSTGLTGVYALDIREGATGYCYFTVSDYKMPTFQVELDPVQRGADDTATITGTVKTFSGFPLADCQVEIAVKRARFVWWWWSMEGIPFLNLSVKTDATGRFTAVLTAEQLQAANSAKRYGYTASAISPNGERQSDEGYFNLGKPYFIMAQIPGNINAADFKVLDVKVIDADKRPQQAPVTYTLTRDGKTYLDHAATLDLAQIPSGQYTLEIATADPQLADAETQLVTIYRPTDTTTPNGELLWMPKSRLTAQPDGTCHVTYAVQHDQQLVNIFVNDGSGQRPVLQQLTPGGGFHTLDVTVAPEGRVQVRMVSVYQGEMCEETIWVEAAPRPALVIEADSWRDHLQPGTPEKWHFKVSVGGEARQAAIIADMYNAALDKIKPYQMRVLPWQTWGNKFYQLSLDKPDNYDCEERYYHSLQLLEQELLQSPMWQTYGQGFGFGMMIRGTYASVNSAKLQMMDRSMGMADESAEFAAPSVADSAEEWDEGEAPEEEAKTDTQQAADEPLEYRDAEVPLAFFRPTLTTDAQGNLDIEFTVPNANAEWRLMLKAWTQALENGELVHSFVSSKPLMVQPNMPRFVRTGDDVQVQTLVMNNSDEAMTVKVHIEFFNPVTGKVIEAIDRTVTLEAKASETVAVNVKVADDWTTLGLRARATAPGASDGEQTAIPVLSSTIPVTESEPFYAGPDQRNIAIDIKPVPADADVLLTYCDNPQWYCVTALPGLRAEAGLTANSAMAAIYSAGIATKLMNDNPQIANAIKRWTAEGDSALISMLERNQELKIALLEATPWVQAAASDTERMARLALLFQPKQVEQSLTQAIELLKKLEANGGGWRWIEQIDKPSMWTTLNVLDGLGQLKQLDALPADKQLDKMIANAVRCLDRETAEQYAQAKRGGDYTYYQAVRDYFKDIPQSSAAQRVTNYTVQLLVDTWRQKSLSDKVIAAQIMNNNGYQATARVVLESLREYSQCTPQKGRWFPSLYDNNAYGWLYNSPVAITAQALIAFHQADPGCVEVDQLRQWLILQKQGQDWGSAATTTEVISAMFLVSPHRVEAARPFVVKVDGRAVDTKAQGAAATIGEVQLPLADARRVDIDRMGDTPAWGAVMYQYQAAPTAVKAAGCDALTIQKDLLVQQAATAEGGEPVWQVTTSAQVGQLARVRLTLQVSQDLDYVMIEDCRAACFEPVDQLPGTVFSQGICFYRECRDTATNLFVTRLPKGTYVLTYDVNVNNAGNYASGIATAQSQYAPALTAHSAASPIYVK